MERKSVCSHEHSQIIPWLKDNYKGTTNNERVPCESVLFEMKKLWPEASNRQLGTCIKNAFPDCKRMRSNSIYYYSNLVKITPEPSLHDVESIENTCTVTVIPHIFKIERKSIFYGEAKNVVGNGMSSSVFIGSYEGITVAVKEFSQDYPLTKVQREVLFIINMKPHDSLPVFVGVCMQEKPYILLYKFYGNVQKQVSRTVKTMLEMDGQFAACTWVRIIIDISKAVSHFHVSGYVHGNVVAEHILIYYSKKDKNATILGPYRIKLVGMGNQANSTANLLQEEISSLGKVIQQIYARMDKGHHSLQNIIKEAINEDKLGTYPSADKISSTFAELLESGYFS